MALTSPADLPAARSPAFSGETTLYWISPLLSMTRWNCASCSHPSRPIVFSPMTLGWIYEFWQAQRKEEVNKSGKKIGADELAPVTQLFTEDYMVEFLLHNTLGAWWAGKIGPIRAVTEEEARAHATLPSRDGAPTISWTYLRFVQDETTKTWLPAAGFLTPGQNPQV